MAKKKKATPRKTSPSRSSSNHIPANVSKLPKRLDPALKSVWVDFMKLSMRKEAIPVSELTFFTQLDGKVLAEAVRVNMTTTHLRRVADVICRAIAYYPKKKR